MKFNKKIISWISSSILSIIMVNVGLSVVKEETIIGIITILIGFILLYFSYYAFQIRENEKKIKHLEEWIQTKEEILNTLKDIVILKKVSKIK